MESRENTHYGRAHDGHDASEERAGDPGAEQGGLRDRVRELGDRADAIGARGFRRVADVLEQTSETLEARGEDMQAARAAADPIRRVGRYVGDSTPKTTLMDLDRAIERHPYRSLALGLGVGWVLGRLVRRGRAG